MPPSPWLSARMMNEQVLDDDDERQRPEDERQDAEHVRRASAPTPCGAREALLHRVERRRADVAVDDAERAERELREVGAVRDLTVRGRRVHRRRAERDGGAGAGVDADVARAPTEIRSCCCCPSESFAARHASLGRSMRLPRRGAIASSAHVETCVSSVLRKARPLLSRRLILQGEAAALTDTVAPDSYTGQHPDGPRESVGVGHLGRYQVIGRLATGGMAEVYLALSGELSGYRTLVVVKRILPHLASNQEFIRMFLDEARIAALLDHPNVVRIIEVGHDGDEYFLVMELVQGKPLSAITRKAAKDMNPLTPALSAYIVAQAANGLGYAHNLADSEGRPLGVVHRDVSPQNILVSFEGAVKVIDFGIVRALGRVSQTNPGGLKGKIEYMSPEQASSEEVDQRADVFALGVVLWEAVTGRHLFRRDTELATMRAIVDEPIPPPSDITPVAPQLEQIIVRALQKKREDRFQTAQEMAMALERYAFSSEGFSPLQLANYVKELFDVEFAQWKKTVSSALDIEAKPGVGVSQSGTRFPVIKPDLPTRGPTVALRKGSRRRRSGWAARQRRRGPRPDDRCAHGRADAARLDLGGQRRRGARLHRARGLVRAVEARAAAPLPTLPPPAPRGGRARRPRPRRPRRRRPSRRRRRRVAPTRGPPSETGGAPGPRLEKPSAPSPPPARPHADKGRTRAHASPKRAPAQAPAVPSDHRPNPFD